MVPNLLAIFDGGVYANLYDATSWLFTPEAERYKLGDFRKSLSAGAEVTLLDFLSVRLGIQNWAFSAGVGLDLFKTVAIDAALYVKEMGTKVGDNQVPVAQISISVTPNFK
jgi:hypothetical protein